jgi:hypothetical protein
MTDQADVLDVQVGDGDGLDGIGVPSQLFEAFDERAALHAYEYRAVLRYLRDVRSVPGVDQQSTVTALDEQAAAACSQASVLIDVFGVRRPVALVGAGEQSSRPDLDCAVWDERDLYISYISDVQGHDAGYAPHLV